MADQHFVGADGQSGGIDPRTSPDDPLVLLRAWLAHADAAGVRSPRHVTFATADTAGNPSSRTLQLLALEEHALLFTTDIGSRKGREMTATGRAAVTFYWRETRRAVNLTGTVELADDRECDVRFANDDLIAQSARAVSRQGEPDEDHEALMGRFQALVDCGRPMGRPAYWRWFRVVPDSVSFWEDMPGSLNRRLHYTMRGNFWRRDRVQP